MPCAETKTARDLRAVGAPVHAQHAAELPGDAAQEGQAGQPGGGGRRGELHVRHAGTRDDVLALDRQRGEAFAEPHHDAVEPAVAHEKVGARTDHRHGNPIRTPRQEEGEVVLVGGQVENLRRAARS